METNKQTKENKQTKHKTLPKCKRNNRKCEKVGKNFALEMTPKWYWKRCSSKVLTFGITFLSLSVCCSLGPQSLAFPVSFQRHMIVIWTSQCHLAPHHLHFEEKKQQHIGFKPIKQCFTFNNNDDKVNKIIIITTTAIIIKTETSKNATRQNGLLAGKKTPLSSDELARFPLYMSFLIGSRRNFSCHWQFQIFVLFGINP